MPRRGVSIDSSSFLLVRYVLCSHCSGHKGVCFKSSTEKVSVREAAEAHVTSYFIGCLSGQKFRAITLRCCQQDSSPPSAFSRGADSSETRHDAKVSERLNQVESLRIARTWADPNATSRVAILRRVSHNYFFCIRIWLRQSTVLREVFALF